MIISSYPTLYMSLWLKAEGYSVSQTNNLPTIIYAINIVASWLGTTLAAIYPSWIIYTIATICCLFSTICMIIWNISTTLKFVYPSSWTTYILTTTYICRMVFLWACGVYESHLILNGEYHCQRWLRRASPHPGMYISCPYHVYIHINRGRQGSMMTFGYSFNIWVPLVLFPTAGPDGAPRWRKGWPVTFVFFFLLWAGFVVSVIIYRRWVWYFDAKRMDYTDNVRAERKRGALLRYHLKRTTRIERQSPYRFPRTQKMSIEPEQVKHVRISWLLNVVGSVVLKPSTR